MSPAIGTGPIRALVVVTYLAMVAMNFLANALPLNGRRTGEVSNEYQNLFTPAGLTFSIWSVIYLLLGAHVLYQLGLFHGSPGRDRVPLLNPVGVLFSVSSVANAAWVFAWHYGMIPLSVVLIGVILVCLILITNNLRSAKLTVRERWFVGVPFSVYFGWTTVATVANITVLLVSLDWDGFGMADWTWAVIIVVIAMVIGTITTLRNQDVAYGLVLIWAYGGILFRQVSPEGLDGRYPVVIGAVVVSLVVFILVAAVVLRQRRSAVGLRIGR